MEITRFDGSTFQRPLMELAVTMINKVEREALTKARLPIYTQWDLAMFMRMSKETLNLIFFLNSDESLSPSSASKPIYTIVIAPMVRNMIDNFYNTTYILRDPMKLGKSFRLSGILKEQMMIDAEEALYKGIVEWDTWVKESRYKLDISMRQHRFTQAEVDAAGEWPTLGQYIKRQGKGGKISDHQKFLSRFLYGPWRHYSAQAHGGPEALRAVSIYFNTDIQPFDDRPLIADGLERVRSFDVLRASLILLATITELQAYFKFDGANINERIRKVWDALMFHMDVKELWDARYQQLIKDRGMFVV